MLWEAERKGRQEQATAQNAADLMPDNKRWLLMSVRSGHTVQAISGFASMCFDFIIPPRCAGCGTRVEVSNHLCPQCWSEMEWIDKPYCSISGLPFSHDLAVADDMEFVRNFEFASGSDDEDERISASVLSRPLVYDRARAVTAFGDTARSLVHQLKYYDRTDLAQVMGKWMVRAGSACLDDPDSWIVPVPLHVSRLWWRRYNQAAMLGKVIATETGLSFQPDLLRRVRPTRQQVGLSGEERRSNVEGAFQLHLPNRVSLSGRRIVLIDDVWTTGATLEACCRVLRRADAGEICIITFARVVEKAEMPI